MLAMIDFLLSPITDVILKPYLDEKFRALKYQQYLTYAQKLLGHKKTVSLGKQTPRKKARSTLRKDIANAERGIGTLAELARSYPYNLQEIIDVLTSFIREKWHKNNAISDEWNPVLVKGLRILAAFPKKDHNGWPYHVELTQIRVGSVNESIKLQRLNLENFVLWGTEFVRADLAWSNFTNTDLGGCQFVSGSSVEWCDFSGALMNFSYLDKVCTTFDDTRLWGSQFETARIDKCRIHITDGFDVGTLIDKHGDRIEIWR